MIAIHRKMAVSLNTRKNRNAAIIGLIDSDDLHLSAHPLRRQVNTTAVAAGSNPFFDDLLAKEFEFYFLRCSKRNYPFFKGVVIIDDAAGCHCHNKRI